MYEISTAFHTGILPVIFVAGLAALKRVLDALALAKRKALIRRIGLVLLLILTTALILTTGWGLEKAGSLLRNPGNFVEALAAHQKIAARDRAAYLRDLQPRNLLDLFLQIPIRIVHFLFMPFPWLVSSLVDLLGLGIAICNFFLLLLVLRSLPGILERKEGRWILRTVLALLITFALGTSNYGTGIRHSSKLVPLVFATIRIPKVKI